MRKKILAVLLIVTLLITSVGGSLLSATAEENVLNPIYTFANQGFTFEKISHANTGLKQPDGIVDYVGGGAVTEYVEGVTSGAGDRGQSYTYAACTYGDWIYLNTMYGGLGVNAILSRSLASLGLTTEQAKALVDTMYNGCMYYGEPDGRYAGGILMKYNVKTGESKILMSRELNGLIPTFRYACMLGDKMYFVGMIVDTSKVSPSMVDYAIAVQDGQPCLYEVDPKTDTFKEVFDTLDGKDYQTELVANNIFPSTRAIGVFKDHLVTGGVEAKGGFLAISANPSEGHDSFVRIAEMEDLFNYPAHKRTAVNSGGSIYQVIEYNNSLYVVICTGSAETYNPETGTMRSFAIVRGDCNGDPTDKASWTWTAVVGDKENDGAKYTFGIDPERVSAGACTLEVYNDHLYIGEYNDVSNALQNFAKKLSLLTQATNLEQSINMYRMDKDENIELVVGDATEMFPEGSLTGWGSGYESHMNQYTWQTTVYEGKLYVGTMDTTTLLRPLAMFVNGELFSMNDEDMIKQLNYLFVLIELLTGADMPEANEDTADQINAAVAAVEEKLSEFMENPVVELTAEQIAQLVELIESGAIQDAIDSLTGEEKAAFELLKAALIAVGTKVGAEIAEEVLEEVLENSAKLYVAYKVIEKLIPDSMKDMMEFLLDNVLTETNIKSILKMIPYMATSVAGFDLYEIEEQADGSITVKTITNNGFGDPYNHGLRIFAKTTDYLAVGTANPFYGTQLWRVENTIKVTPTPDPDPTPNPNPNPNPTPDPELPDVPQTGGSANTTVWFTLMAISGVAMIVVIAAKKRATAR